MAEPPAPKPEPRAGRRSEVNLGDALYAARSLGLVAEADLDRLVSLLGLEVTPPARADRRVPPAERPAARPPGVATAQPVTLSRHDAAEPSPLPPGRIRQTIAQDPVWQDLGEDPPSATPLSTAQPLAPPTPGIGVVPYEAPVPRQQLRAALSRLIRRTRPGSDVDVEALVDAASSARPLTEIPFVSQPTLDRGATVVADIGPSMLPYLADVAHMVEEIRKVAGSPLVDVVWCTRPPDAPPPTAAGRPLIVISTLGAVAPSAGARADVQWSRFARAASLTDVEVAALVPHRRRWPGDVQRGIRRVVAWDDLAAVGRGHS